MRTSPIRRPCRRRRSRHRPVPRPAAGASAGAAARPDDAGCRRRQWLGRPSRPRSGRCLPSPRSLIATSRPAGRRTRSSPTPAASNCCRPHPSRRPPRTNPRPTPSGAADEIPQEWEDDWRSGDWAMPPSGLPGPPAEVPAESPAAPVDEARPAESFDIFETSAPPAPVGTGAGESDVEKTGRTAVRRTEVRADVDPGPRRPPPAEQHPDVSLFDSPTARVGRPPRPGGPVRPPAGPPAAEMPRRLPAPRGRPTSRSSATHRRRTGADPTRPRRICRAKDVDAAPSRRSRSPPLPRPLPTPTRRCWPGPSGTSWPSCRPSSPRRNGVRARTGGRRGPTSLPPSTGTGPTATGSTATGTERTAQPGGRTPPSPDAAG